MCSRWRRIAGEDDATYLQVLNAIQAAEKAGFVDWKFTDGPGLAARPQL